MRDCLAEMQEKLHEAPVSGEMFRSTAVQHVSSQVYIALGITMSVVFVFGIIENIIVLVVYSGDRRVRTKTNLWIFAILICDLLLLVNTNSYVIINCFAERNLFGDIGCLYDGFLVTVLGTTSIFLLAGISIHRYGVIMNIECVKRCRKREVSFGILLCFVCGLFWGTAPLVGWGSFALEGIGISCAPNWRSHLLRDRSYTIAMYVFVLLIPLFIFGFCYSCILKKVSA